MNETVAIIVAIVTACGACGAGGAWRYFQDDQDEINMHTPHNSECDRPSDHTLEDIIHDIAQRNSDNDTEIDIKISIHATQFPSKIERE